MWINSGILILISIPGALNIFRLSGNRARYNRTVKKERKGKAGGPKTLETESVDILSVFIITAYTRSFVRMEIIYLFIRPCIVIVYALLLCEYIWESSKYSKEFVTLLVLTLKSRLPSISYRRNEVPSVFSTHIFMVINLMNLTLSYLKHTNLGVLLEWRLGLIA